MASHSIHGFLRWRVSFFVVGLCLLFFYGYAAPKHQLRPADELTDSDESDVLNAKRSKLTDSESEGEVAHEPIPSGKKSKPGGGASSSAKEPPTSKFKQRFLNEDVLRAHLKGQCPCAQKKLDRGAAQSYDIKSCINLWNVASNLNGSKHDLMSYDCAAPRSSFFCAHGHWPFRCALKTSSFKNLCLNLLVGGSLALDEAPPPGFDFFPLGIGS
jgi:hypothetical protein